MSLHAAEAKKASFVTTNAVFIARSIRLSLRNPEDLIMAIMLPIILMLLFTFVFGGALDAGGDTSITSCRASYSSAPAMALPILRWA